MEVSAEVYRPKGTYPCCKDYSQGGMERTNRNAVKESISSQE